MTAFMRAHPCKRGSVRKSGTQLSYCPRHLPGQVQDVFDVFDGHMIFMAAGIGNGSDTGTEAADFTHDQQALLLGLNRLRGAGDKVGGYWLRGSAALHGKVSVLPFLGMWQYTQRVYIEPSKKPLMGLK